MIQKKENDLSIVKQVIALKNLSLSELDKLWSKMFDAPPAFRTKNYMIPKLAYKIQELAYGGIDAETEKKLKYEANHLEKGKKYSPMVGTKIVKEYKGKMLEVTVVEEGFSFEGNIFKSLSAVAQKITGTKWNGPRFFNVNEAA